MSATTDRESDEEPEQQTTRTTFYNPDARELPSIYSDRERGTAKEHFEAAQYLQEELGAARTRLFGEFAVAVQQLQQADDVSKLAELVGTLLEGNVASGQDTLVTTAKRVQLDDGRELLILPAENQLVVVDENADI